MYSAIDEHDLEFQLVHEKDGSRIGYEKVCKKEGKEVPADEIVKAYEISDGELVYLDDADFEAAEEEGYRTIQVLDFVAPRRDRPDRLQRTYYLGPANGAEKVYLAPRCARWRSPTCRPSSSTCSARSSSSAACACARA